jgi:hypothetical protein
MSHFDEIVNYARVATPKAVDKGIIVPPPHGPYRTMDCPAIAVEGVEPTLHHRYHLRSDHHNAEPST